MHGYGRSQWPRGIRCRSVAACPLRLRVQIPLGKWMFVCCKRCVLSGRGLCIELITRPEGSYRLWCVGVCDLENFVNEEALAHWGAAAPKTNNARIWVLLGFLLGRGLLECWRWNHSLLQNASNHSPVTKHYTSRNLNPQQQCNENFKYRMLFRYNEHMMEEAQKPSNNNRRHNATSHSLTAFSHHIFNNQWTMNEPGSGVWTPLPAIHK